MCYLTIIVIRIIIITNVQTCATLTFKKGSSLSADSPEVWLRPSSSSLSTAEAESILSISHPTTECSKPPRLPSPLLLLLRVLSVVHSRSRSPTLALLLLLLLRGLLLCLHSGLSTRPRVPRHNEDKASFDLLFRCNEEAVVVAAAS